MSRIRRVADRREVFQTTSCSSNRNNNNNDARGSCFIVELLDLDTINASDDESCSKCYFADLSKANDAVNENLLDYHTHPIKHQHRQLFNVKCDSEYI